MVFLRHVLIILAAVHMPFAAAYSAAEIRERPLTQGAGIFVKVHHGKSQTDLAGLVQNPYIAGASDRFYWSELEPREGEYHWEFLEEFLAPWAKVNKKVVLAIGTAGKLKWGKNPYARYGTPEWVFQKGVRKIEIPGKTSIYPQYWDQGYQRELKKFLSALANKYDGDPRIEFIRIGGYSAGSEPNLSGDDRKALMGQWTAVGFDGFAAGGVYSQAIKSIMDIWSNSFNKTPLAASIHFNWKGGFEEELNKHAVGKRFILLNNGLSVRTQARSRQAFKDYFEQGLKTGWGGLGHYALLEEKPSSKKRRKDKGGEGNRRSGKRHQDDHGERDYALIEEQPSAMKGRREKRQEPDRPRRRRHQEGQGEQDLSMVKKQEQIMRLFQQAIGDESQPELSPKSHVSYILLDENVVRSATPDTPYYSSKYEAAIKYAFDHLEPRGR